MVEHGEFRRDLYYRLRVVVVEVPPLRERRSDIPLLARHFLEVYGERFNRPGLQLSHEALASLMQHGFPGNVRELENAIQAAVALAPGETIDAEDLRLETETPTTRGSGGLQSLHEIERQHIEAVLAAVNGNRQAAARILGIDRTTLYRKLQRFATYDANSIN
jgi:DNA-binding NtrC family response regulator